MFSSLSSRKAYEPNCISEHKTLLRYRIRVFVSTILGMLFISGPLYAVPLGIGETIPLSGTTLAQRPDLTGPIVDYRHVSFEVVQGSETLVSGSIDLWLSSLVGDNRLVEFYQLNEITDYTGLGYRVNSLYTGPQVLFPTVDVDYLLDSPGLVGPNSASSDFFYGPVRFDFGSESRDASLNTMFVVTNNDLFEFGGFWGAHVTLVNDSGSMLDAPFESYITFIPEPAIWQLMLLGIGFLAWWPRPFQNGFTEYRSI